MISNMYNSFEQTVESNKMNEPENNEDTECLSSVETETDSQILDAESTHSEPKAKKAKKGHEKKHTFCIQKSVFRNVLKEILEGRSISEEAVHILHESAENHVSDVFSKAKKILNQTNRRTMSDKDIKLVIELMS